MNDPYVPTNRGWRRKIGPASKYRFNAAPQNGEDGTLYGNHPGSRFTGQTSVGRVRPHTESKFSLSLREAREISEANSAMERREKQRTNQAKRAEAEKKAASAAPSSAAKNAASVAAFGSGKAPAATQSAPAAPVMSREERNKIEEERRAKGYLQARGKTQQDEDAENRRKVYEEREQIAGERSKFTEEITRLMKEINRR